MADDEKQRARRRFLQHLEQSVRGFRIFQLVSGIDHAHPPAALACRRAEEAHRAAYLLDRNDGTKLVVVADRAFEHEQVRMPLRRPIRSRVASRRAIGWVGATASDVAAATA